MAQADASFDDGRQAGVGHVAINRLIRVFNPHEDVAFFFYNGDGDLCLKLWQRGYTIIASPDSYIEHYPHANIAIRKTNYDRFNQDLKNYLVKWDGIF